MGMLVRMGRVVIMMAANNDMMGRPLGPLGDADGSPSLGSPKSGSEVLGGSQDGVDGWTSF